MPTLTVNIPQELSDRLNNWSSLSNMPAQRLALELLEEYFDDCDDADRLEALITSGTMKTYPADTVHREMNSLAALAH